MTWSWVVALVLVASYSAFALGVADDNMLEGVWRPALAELGGQAFPDEVRKSIKLEIKGDTYTVTVGETLDRGTCKLDVAATPKALDIIGTDGPNKGKTILAIYELNGDTLRVCYDLSGKSRPAKFESATGTLLFLVEYKRQKS